MENIKEKYKNIPFTPDQWHQLDLANRAGIDTFELANPRFTAEQMKILREAKGNGIDISMIRSPDIPAQEMKRMLGKIYDEMGFYHAQYEKTRRLWLKNITWIGILIIFIVSIGSILYMNRDSLALYFADLQLELTTQTVELATNQEFNPGSYIASYSENGDLLLPEKIDTSLPGTYIVEYRLSNGKKSISKDLIINVKDTVAPKIQLSDNRITLKKSDVFLCHAYIENVSDNVDQLSLEDVLCSNEIDFESNEQYVTYSVSDASNNTTEEKTLSCY